MRFRLAWWFAWGLLFVLLLHGCDLRPNHPVFYNDSHMCVISATPEEKRDYVWEGGEDKGKPPTGYFVPCFYLRNGQPIGYRL